MPTVEAYGQRKVKTAALPGVRKTNSAETFESAGGPIAQGQEQLAKARGGVGEAIAGLGVQTIRAGGAVLSLNDQFRQDERTKAGQVAVMGGDRELANWEQQHVDGPGGALSVRGKAVLPLHDTVLEAFDRKADEIEQGLPTEEAKIAFRRAADGRRESIGKTLATHSLRELQQYDADETKAYVDSAHSAAVAHAGDAPRVAQELGRGELAIRTYAARNGVSADVVKQQLAEFRSGVHVGVIHRMLTDEHPGAARIYFEETHDQIEGDKLDELKGALEEGGQRKQAQQMADEILAAGGTLTEQRAKAREMTDGDKDPTGKIRDAVMERLEHEDAVAQKAKNEQDEATLRGAYDIVEKYGTVTKIPPSVWRSLSGASRSSLRGYADALLQGTPIKTDPITYYTLKEQASNDPDEFLKVNLLNLQTKLSPGDFQEFVQLRAAIKGGKAKEAAEALNSYRTTAAIVDDSLHQAGLDTSSSKDNPDLPRVAEFRRIVDERVQSLAGLTGKKVTDVQPIVDSLLREVTTAPPAWWTFGFGSPTIKRRFEITIADVPRKDLEQITAGLRAKKLMVTNPAILRIYLAQLDKDAAGK